MKIIEIFGENYSGKINKVRKACRALIVQDSKILTSHESVNDLYMLPGGGLEDNETDQECAIREVLEETGMIIEASECVLELDEYYEDVKYVTMYFLGNIVGEGKKHLTEEEKRLDMNPIWLPIEEAIKIFSGHGNYYEEKRGLYYRELTAIKYILNK